MSIAAPESTNDTVAAGEAATVRDERSPATAHGVKIEQGGILYECLFCCRAFTELMFYGCCSECYAGSSAVRATVDGAYPPTWPSGVMVEGE